MTVYRGAVRFMLTWILPFAFVGFFPSTILMKRYEYIGYALLTPVVGIVFFCLWSVCLECRCTQIQGYWKLKTTEFKLKAINNSERRHWNIHRSANRANGSGNRWDSCLQRELLIAFLYIYWFSSGMHLVEFTSRRDVEKCRKTLPMPAILEVNLEDQEMFEQKWML